MNARHPPVFRSGHAWFAAPLLAAVLAGCAAPGASTADAAPAAAAPQAAAAVPSAPPIAPPPTSMGAWVDLGHVLAPWLSGDGPVPVDGVASPTRLAGLRGSDGQWLAIVIAQVAPAGGTACPQPTSLSLDAGVRDACLRLRRDADFDRWLEKQHPVLYRWVEERQWGARPRAWVSYRAPAAGGQAIETHAFVNPALLEAGTRNNADFLAAGQPGVAWAQRFAAATRAAGAGGALNVPPFPYGPPAPLPPAPPAAEPAAAGPAPAPVQAIQVTPPPRPPAPAPRRDRE